MAQLWFEYLEDRTTPSTTTFGDVVNPSGLSDEMTPPPEAMSEVTASAQGDAGPTAASVGALAADGDVVTASARYMIYYDFGDTWHDANKKLLDFDDSLMCWAASASNILAWSGWGPSVDPAYASAQVTFDYFQDHWTDEGWFQNEGWDWWFNGDNGHTTPPPNGGSYVNVPGGGGFFPGTTFSDHYQVSTDDATAVSKIADFLKDGYGVSLHIVDPGIDGSHAITAWGYEYDPADPDQIYGIWITDSDPDLYLFPVRELSYHPVEKQSDGNWHILDYDGDDWYIITVYGLQRVNAAPVLDAGPNVGIDEGATLARTVSFTDPDDFKWTVEVDYGDGSDPVQYQLQGETTFDLNHAYADNAVYRVRVQVTDPIGETTSDSFFVTVNNVAPTLTLSGAPNVDEGSTYTLDLASSDSGADTINRWFINWGDGSDPDGDGNVGEIVSGDPSEVTHTYADGTAPRTITASATDEDGTFDAGSISLTVNNVAPTLTFTGSSLNLNANGQPIPFSGVRGQTLNFTGTMSDPGFDHPAGSPPTTETFTYSVDWGDGTSTGVLPPSVYSAGSPGVPTTGAFSGSHVYADAGTYFIAVRIRDDDGGERLQVHPMTIAANSLQVGGDLAVGGTEGKDEISFLARNGAIKLKTGWGKYTYADVSRILAFGQRGSDSILVENKVAVPAVLQGGPGSDHLVGGRGISILDGGPGDDQLVGGRGDSVLKGGPGNDCMLGGKGCELLLGGSGSDGIVGSGNDLLIAGTLDFADFDAATTAIMAEWTSSHDRATRMANLRGKTEADGNPGYGDRLNDGYFLKLGETVWDDAEKDVLMRAPGDDWFCFDDDQVIYKAEPGVMKVCPPFV